MLDFNSRFIYGLFYTSDIFLLKDIYSARNEDVPSLFLRMYIMLNQDKLQQFSLYAYNI